MSPFRLFLKKLKSNGTLYKGLSNCLTASLDSVASSYTKTTLQKFLLAFLGGGEAEGSERPPSNMGVSGYNLHQIVTPTKDLLLESGHC